MAKKRNDTRYQKNFRFDGKRYSVYGKSIKEVEMKKAKKLQELQEGIVNRENPTMNIYYEIFTERRRGSIKESTLREQKSQFNKCANVPIVNAKTFGELRIRDVKASDIQAVQMALKAKGNSTRTINDAIHHISHVFNEAIKDRTVTYNPCIAINSLRRTEQPARETKHRALTKEETSLFLETAADSFYLNAFKFMLCTGMRLGEMTALLRSDIDNKYIHITKTITRNEDGAYVIGDSAKTYDSHRDIPLTNQARTLISDQLKINSIMFGNVIDPKKPIFLSSKGEILREYTFNREIKRITQRCGIEKFTSHAFRATFATRFIEQRGEDYKILSEILGHSDVKITLNLYTHVMDDAKVKAMQELEIAF